ncbi:MAG TPA: phosphatase PAP2 family protein [Chthonomonadaceae bacterium]|nr:phosphatase PAP2 family protein [Chthonomonadaceae bacterium]
MDRKLGGWLCNICYVSYLAAASVWPALCDSKHCMEKLARTATALGLTAAIVQALKQTVPERRPDSGQRGSFPSGHSANTMVLAALCSAEHAGPAAAWFLPAAGISLARIVLRRHHVRDVVIGSLIGLLVDRAVSW